VSEPNFAGNIIVNLASLPDFLRKTILKKKMTEFFLLPEPEKHEIINNALEAGPTIPFPNFAKLFKTWLETLCKITNEQRTEILSIYLNEISRKPIKIITFNLDGIFEIFMTLEKSDRVVLSNTMRNVIQNLDEERKKRLLMIIPDNVKKQIEV